MAEHHGIFYTDTASDRPPLILIHGYCCDHTDWDAQAADLAVDFRVIAVDLPGHGSSTQVEPSIELIGRVIADLIDDLELSEAVIAGHSMGTRVVAEVARLVPGRIAGAIFVDGSRGASSEADLEKIREIRSANSFDDYARRLFSQMFTEKTDKATAKRVVERAASMDPDWAMALHNDVAEYDAHKLPTSLGEMAAPVLVIQATTRSPEGRRASLAENQTTEYTNFVQSSVEEGQCRVATIADTGHFPQFDEPKALNELMRTFALSVR